ncbi:hypothetical protein TNIN_460921 [Trichonephila inaurata madagascariensis]|uniref:Uncharacterized protein n=1 Tax=Trichonephila inaurata madagascariensis TaxID=2747483 RepID=A0A8X7BQ65_9ARAC|nr:hypothetical protein TNIN_460921 [Trichonephila inaurata madagascariensis]
MGKEKLKPPEMQKEVWQRDEFDSSPMNEVLPPDGRGRGAKMGSQEIDNPQAGGKKKETSSCFIDCLLCPCSHNYPFGRILPPCYCY